MRLWLGHSRRNCYFMNIALVTEWTFRECITEDGQPRCQYTTNSTKACEPNSTVREGHRNKSIAIALYTQPTSQQDRVWKDIADGYRSNVALKSRNLHRKSGRNSLSSLRQS